MFAGSNAGVITNCDVVNITELISEDGTITADGLNKAITVKTSLISGSNYTTNYVGLFVGQNTGYITNSRVFRTTGNIGTRENVNDKATKIIRGRVRAQTSLQTALSQGLLHTTQVKSALATQKTSQSTTIPSSRMLVTPQALSQ